MLQELNFTLQKVVIFLQCNIRMAHMMLVMLVMMTIVFNLLSQVRGLRVLVAGGSGFVGGRLCQLLSDKQIEVVTVSRRGLAPSGTGITGVKCDVAEKSEVDRVMREYGPFDGIFHAIGLLLDQDSGLSSLNKFASGSGSVPGGRGDRHRPEVGSSS